MSKEARIILFGLAALNVIGLLYVTWEMGRLSSWIVSADHVWAEMDRTGHRSEHYAAEAFHQIRDGIVIVECAAGVAFLTMLWRCIFSSPAEPPTER